MTVNATKAEKLTISVIDNATVFDDGQTDWEVYCPRNDAYAGEVCVISADSTSGVHVFLCPCAHVG